KARTTAHARNSILGPRQITPSPITKRYSPLFRRKTESTACGYQPNCFCVGSARVSRVMPVRLGLCASRANELPSGERRLLAETKGLVRERYNGTSLPLFPSVTEKF